MTTSIRDLREAKLLSQDNVADAVGITYGVFCRIESGAGKTTAEEVDRVFSVLQGMEPGTRKLAGRPFKNPDVRARVAAARAAGESVSAALSYVSTTPPEPFSFTEDEPKSEAWYDRPDPSSVPEPFNFAEDEPETRQQRKNRLARERAAAKKLL